MNENKNAGRFHLRNDIIFVVALLVVCALGMLYLFVIREGGDTVKVTVDGKLYGIYSLSDNTQHDIITGQSGENLNRLVISDGKAYVETATCPDGICVDHRPVFRDGESIVCLPNRVVVTVNKADDTVSPDVVA